MGTSELPSVDVATIRAAMGAWATGVVVVTATHPDGRDAGLVMVSLAPVSQEPPQLAGSTIGFLPPQLCVNRVLALRVPPTA